MSFCTVLLFFRLHDGFFALSVDQIEQYGNLPTPHVIRYAMGANFSKETGKIVKIRDETKKRKTEIDHQTLYEYYAYTSTYECLNESPAMVPNTECGDHIMLLHGDRVKLNGTHGYHISQLARCLTLRADLARAVAHTRQASFVRHSNFDFYLIPLCVQQQPTLQQGE